MLWLVNATTHKALINIQSINKTNRCTVAASQFNISCIFFKLKTINILVVMLFKATF